MTPDNRQSEGQGETQQTVRERLDDLLDLSPREPETYRDEKSAVRLLVDAVVRQGVETTRVNRDLIDAIIADLDRRLGAQVNEILHQPEFKRIESAWRSLYFLVQRTDFRENIEIDVLNVSKADLQRDFEDSGTPQRSGLFHHIYSSEYGVFGGQPFGAIVGNYEFGPGNADITLLRNCGKVAQAAHCPFIAGVSPEFIGEKDFRPIQYVKNMAGIFDGAKFAKWKAFRESEESRYVALAMPRFLLRAPYQSAEGTTRNFSFDEDLQGAHENYSWGNAAFALANRLTESFARWRWCPNIVGPRSGGAVEDLPMHAFESMGDTTLKCPTEVQLPEQHETAHSEKEGLVTLVWRKGSDNAAFFAAPSCHKAGEYPRTEAGFKAQTSDELSSQLPYLFIVSRMAHYLKAIHREHVGEFTDRAALETEMNAWMQQFVTKTPNPTKEVRMSHPLRDAGVDVTDVAGKPGWYEFKIRVSPHFQYKGAHFDLSLVGQVDQKK